MKDNIWCYGNIMLTKLELSSSSNVCPRQSMRAFRIMRYAKFTIWFKPQLGWQPMTCKSMFWPILVSVLTSPPRSAVKAKKKKILPFLTNPPPVSLHVLCLLLDSLSCSLDIFSHSLTTTNLGIGIAGHGRRMMTRVRLDARCERSVNAANTCIPRYL